MRTIAGLLSIGRTGDHVTVSITCGTPSFPVDSLYGIAFTINLDTNLIYRDSTTTDFNISWLGNLSSDMISFTKTSNLGQFDIALVRNDQTNVFLGNGVIGLFDVVIVDNVSTVQSQLMRVSNVHAITADATPIRMTSSKV